jgi:hypothetical protein
MGVLPWVVSKLKSKVSPPVGGILKIDPTLLTPPVVVMP